MAARSEQHGLRELDQRKGDGVEVTLLWSERTGSVYVAVEDAHEQPGFSFIVKPADALDAFRHPYAYARCDVRLPALDDAGLHDSRPGARRAV